MSLILRNKLRFLLGMLLTVLTIASIFGFWEYRQYVETNRILRIGPTFGLDSKINDGIAVYYKLVDKHRFILLIDQTHYSKEYFEESPEVVLTRVYVLGKYKKKGDEIRLLGAGKAIALYFENSDDAENNQPFKKSMESKKELKEIYYAKAVFTVKPNRKTKVTVNQGFDRGVWKGYVWKQNIKVTDKYLK